MGPALREETRANLLKQVATDAERAVEIIAKARSEKAESVLR